MFVICSFNLLVGVWFMSIVYTLTVACFFGFVCSQILPLHILFVYHLPSFT